MFHNPSLDSSSVSAEEVPVVSMDEDSDEFLEYTDMEEIVFENVDQLFTMETEDELTQVQYNLPSHEKCAAHTFNLVAGTDIDKYLSTSPVSRNLYRSLLAKC